MDTNTTSSPKGFQLNPLIANAQNNIQLEKKINSQNQPQAKTQESPKEEKKFALRDYSKYLIGAAVLGIVLVKGANPKADTSKFQEYFDDFSGMQKNFNRNLENLAKKVEAIQEPRQDNDIDAFLKLLDKKMDAIGFLIQTQNDKTASDKAFENLNEMLDEVLDKLNNQGSLSTDEFRSGLNNLSEMITKSAEYYKNSLKLAAEVPLKAFNEITDALKHNITVSEKGMGIHEKNTEILSSIVASLEINSENLSRFYGMQEKISQQIACLEKSIEDGAINRDDKETKAAIEMIKKSFKDISASVDEIKQGMLQKGAPSNNESAVLPESLEKICKELSEKMDDISSQLYLKNDIPVILDYTKEQKDFTTRGLVFKRGFAYENDIPYSGEITNKMPDGSEVVRKYNNGSIVKSRRYNPSDNKTIFTKEYFYNSESKEICNSGKYNFFQKNSSEVRTIYDAKNEKSYCSATTYENDKKPCRAFTIFQKDLEQKNIVERVRYSPSIQGDVLLDATRDNNLRIVKIKKEKGHNLVFNTPFQFDAPDTRSDGFNIFRIDSKYIV